MLDWPDQEIKLFLLEDVGLDNYEHRQVCVALKRWEAAQD
jgi:hypothetical protein